MFVAAMLMSLMMFQTPDSYVIVLTNGKKMTVKAAPECSGRLCTVMLLNGEKTSLPRTMIDFDESTEVNLALREMRAAEQAAARAAAQDAEPVEEAPKPKPIRLTRDDELPDYAPRDQVAIVTEEEASDGSTNTTVLAVGDDQPIEDPRITDFDSGGDPVYLTRETVTRYADHYRIETIVGTQLLNGARALKLQLKINFENEMPFVTTIEVGDVKFRQPGVAVFDIPRSDAILKTSYNIDYETVEE